jgi:hypothetical protein
VCSIARRANHSPLVTLCKVLSTSRQPSKTCCNRPTALHEALCEVGIAVNEGSLPLIWYRTCLARLLSAPARTNTGCGVVATARHLWRDACLFVVRGGPTRAAIARKDRQDRRSRLTGRCSMRMATGPSTTQSSGGYSSVPSTALLYAELTCHKLNHTRALQYPSTVPAYL